mgnify:CR=1 FL=1
MNLNRILQAGNEARIKNEKVSMITSIDEIVSEDTFTILAPPEPEHRLIMKPGEMFMVTCVTDRGLYMFEIQVTDVISENNVTTIELRAVSDCKKIQRREAFRARESIGVSVRKKPREGEKAAKWVNTRTVNISETGMLVRFNEKCAAEEILELVIRIDNLGIREVLPKVLGKVARCTETGNTQFGYFLGVEFLDLPEKARNTVLKLVVLSQRSKLTYKHIKRYK